MPPYHRIAGRTWAWVGTVHLPRYGNARPVVVTKWAWTIGLELEVDQRRHAHAVYPVDVARHGVQAVDRDQPLTRTALRNDPSICATAWTLLTAAAGPWTCAAPMYDPSPCGTTCLPGQLWRGTMPLWGSAAR